MCLHLSVYCVVAEGPSPTGWVIIPINVWDVPIPIGYAVIMKGHYNMLYVFIEWGCIVIGMKSANS